MKQRNVIAVICYSIITLGIYDLFWLVNTKKELNARTKQQVPSIWVLFAPALVLIATIIIDGIVSAAQSTSGGSSMVSVIVGIIMGIVIVIAAIIVPVYWFLKYSKAVHEYTNGELSTAVTFILLWILRFIGIAVIQDKFNDMVAAGNTSAMPMNGMNSPMPPQAAGVIPTAPVAPPVPAPAAPSSPDQTQQVAPQSSQQPETQSPMSSQPQQLVDPTQPASYEQQSQTPPSPQPPMPPAGPIVQ